jgi:hypothetical protein
MTESSYMKRTNKKVAYLMLLIPSFLIVSLAWTLFVDGTLYYCSDRFPIGDFIPPFVHGRYGNHSTYGDYFIAPEWVVYLVWVIAVIIILLLPLLFLKIKEGFHAERSKQNVVQSKSKLKKI